MKKISSLTFYHREDGKIVATLEYADSKRGPVDAEYDNLGKAYDLEGRALVSVAPVMACLSFPATH